MKKYFMTMVVMAIFAIGFAASDEDSYNKESKAQEEQEQKMEIEENKSDEFLEKGHTYKSSRFRVDLITGGACYCEYELKLYNDGSIDLIETNTYPNHEFEDFTKTFECKIEKKEESKRDLKKIWYHIEGKSGNEVTTLFVDRDGNVYRYSGKDEFEAIGDRNCYQTSFTKVEK